MCVEPLLCVDPHHFFLTGKPTSLLLTKNHMFICCMSAKILILIVINQRNPLTLDPLSYLVQHVEN